MAEPGYLSQVERSRSHPLSHIKLSNVEARIHPVDNSEALGRVLFIPSTKSRRLSWYLVIEEGAQTTRTSTAEESGVGLILVWRAM